MENTSIRMEITCCSCLLSFDSIHMTSATLLIPLFSFSRPPILFLTSHLLFCFMSLPLLFTILSPTLFLLLNAAAAASHHHQLTIRRPAEIRILRVDLHDDDKKGIRIG